MCIATSISMRVFYFLFLIITYPIWPVYCNFSSCVYCLIPQHCDIFLLIHYYYYYYYYCAVPSGCVSKLFFKFRPCIWGDILTLLYFSRVIIYKTGPTERVSLEFVVRDGVCQILPLKLERHSASNISLLTYYTLVTCISKRQTSRSLRWRSLKFLAVTMDIPVLQKARCSSVGCGKE